MPDIAFERTLPDLPYSPTSEIDVLVSLVQGWMSHSGPTTGAELGTVLGLGSDRVDEALLRLEASGWALRGRFTGADGLEWCERRLLARIHRLTLGALRREIAPVTAAEFMRWLLDWQHLTPGSRLSGEHGTLEALRQLQGFEAPASAWERHLLPDRVANYDPAELDRLSLTGVVGWGRLSPHPAMTLTPGDDARRVVPTSAAPITFFVREDADWMVPPATRDRTPAGLSYNARDVFAYLERAGASFFLDIARGVKHLNAEVEAALWELVTAGLVTADGFDSLRALIDPRRRAGQGNARAMRPRHGTGRWSILSPHPAADRTHVVESACRMLLRRYGVVFRELVSREANVPPWRELLLAFRRLEDRGEVRGGRFVSGFLGEQFAMPIAVESLRALRHRPAAATEVTLSAADPLNLVGVVIPGDRVPAIAGRLAPIAV
jgi:ATP-dependent Lhr-like helicase